MSKDIWFPGDIVKPINNDLFPLKFDEAYTVEQVSTNLIKLENISFWYRKESFKLVDSCFGKYYNPCQEIGLRERKDDWTENAPYKIVNTPFYVTYKEDQTGRIVPVILVKQPSGHYAYMHHDGSGSDDNTQIEVENKNIHIPEELKEIEPQPCPFCGHKPTYNRNRGKYHCINLGCGVEGPKGETKTEAANKWNSLRSD